MVGALEVPRGQREAVEAPGALPLDAQFEIDDGRANRQWRLQSVRSSLQVVNQGLGKLVADFGAVVVEFVAVGLLGPTESATKASLEVAAGVSGAAGALARPSSTSVCSR